MEKLKLKSPQMERRHYINSILHNMDYVKIKEDFFPP